VIELTGNEKSHAAPRVPLCAGVFGQQDGRDRPDGDYGRECRGVFAVSGPFSGVLAGVAALAAISRVRPILGSAAGSDSDLFQCNMVGLPECYAQAMERYSACLAGRPIPPFNY
jgi:hypothetical protein